MSLPYVAQHKIDAMQKIAAEKMKNDGIEINDEVVVEPIQQNEVESEVPVDNSEEYEEVASEQVEQVDQPESKNQFEYNQKESNMKSLRDRALKAEREREEALQYIMSMQQQMNPQFKNQQNPVVQEQEDDFNINVDDESLVEGKHLKEILREIKTLRSTVKNYEQKSQKNEISTMEMRLQNQYPDLYDVVTNENCVKLREMNPDLADSILHTPDAYKKAKLTYEMIKQMGIYKDNSHLYQERAIAKNNLTKPRPLTSVSPTKSENPISKVNAFANAPLSEQLKKQYYEEMVQSMKGM